MALVMLGCSSRLELPKAEQQNTTADAGAKDSAKSERSCGEFVGDRRVPFSPQNDLELIDFFIPHHERAIEMARLEVERGASATVKEQAQRIIQSQADGLARMRKARASLSVGNPSEPNDPHMGGEMMMMHTLQGDVLDRVFAEEMIAHHASGIPVAERALPNLVRRDMKELAGSMFTDQSIEIGELEQFLGRATGGARAIATQPVKDDTNVIGDRRVPYTPRDDVAFIDFFIAHHEDAVRMAQIEVSRGTRSDAQALAGQIIDAQTRELRELREARRQLTGSSEPAPQPADPHMLADMSAVQSASGEHVDRLFLRDMTSHHASGIPVAHRAFAHLTHTDMRELSLDISTAQAKEIGEMATMRTRQKEP